MGDKHSKEVKRHDEVSTLSDKDYEFLGVQTGMSHDKIKKVFDEFHTLNPDGKLNRAQFASLYSQLVKETDEGKLSKLCEQIFLCFDTNNDDSIDFYEFMLGFSITTRANPRKKLEYCFHLYDRDGNKFIDELEILKICKGMHALLGVESVTIDKFIDRCMEVLDVTRDGVISREEFIDGLMENGDLREFLMPFN